MNLELLKKVGKIGIIFLLIVFILAGLYFFVNMFLGSIAGTASLVG